MTAVSPYAPPRRNSLLRRSSSSMQSPSPGGRRTALFAFFLFVIRFWKDVADLGGVSDFFKRRPRALRALEWIQNFLGFGDNHSFPSRIIQGIQGGRRPDADGVEFAPIRRISASSSSDQHSEASSVSDAPSTTTFKRIRENQLWIRRVLNYWFGQYAPDHSQKNLWMIANSSVELRYRVDREITEAFETLLLELSSSSEGSRRWSDWCLDQDGIYGHQGKIATIIVLDQFSRHMQRHYENTTKGESQIPSKETLNALALKTAKLFVETHKKEISCGMIPVPMYIFSLMPYRHDNSIKSVVYVQQCVEECAGMNQQMEAMLGRFRKATNRRMAVLQDKARRTGNSSNHNKEDASNGKNDSTMYKDEEILESFPFEADLTPALNHPVHKTIASFLASRGINPSREGKEATEVCSPIIVSLSGGVDSMVIAAVLAHLKRSCGFHLQIIAVHIDYANRPESVAEADFVRRYCETLDITFRCREIKEVTRGVTARDEYEKMSREMRYGSYREAIEVSKEGIDPNVSKDMVVGVMLGHHKGDLRENVLSNAHKGCGPLDLSGMTAVSKNDGVTIYRPLLPLEKSFVFDYAHKFGVPYFKDTTPHWSTRGKLRNKLLPLLEDIYGEGSMKNLSNLATESDECRLLLYKSMIGPFLDQIIRKPMGIIFDAAPWKEQPLFFWKFVLRAALHSAQLGMFSDKSVLSFLERVQANRIREGWLQCRPDYAVYLQKDGKVFVFYPKSFPFHKKNMYNVTGQVVEFGKERKVGPWSVKSEIVSERLDCPDTSRLAQKAMGSMEYLMGGQIEYWLSSPTWDSQGTFKPRPLIFRHFTKACRPLAWKNCDLKVQQTLPLLGNDDSSDLAMKDPKGRGLVHIVDGKEETNPTLLIRVTVRLT